MNRDDYLRFHKDFCDKARDLSARKNNDYAGEGGEKPFANFERVAAMGICSTEQGFLVRMTDKLSRLATFAAGGKLQVADESALDTLLDVVNYGVLLAAFISQKDADDREMLPEDMGAAGDELPSPVCEVVPPPGLHGYAPAMWAEAPPKPQGWGSGKSA